MKIEALVALIAVPMLALAVWAAPPAEAAEPKPDAAGTAEPAAEKTELTDADKGRLLSEMEKLRRRALAEEKALYFDEAKELRDKLAGLVDANYDWLVELTKSPNALLQDQAYKLVACGGAKSDDGIDYLAERMRSAPEAERDKAATALSATRDPRAADVLLDMLAGARTQPDRLRAIFALGELGSPTALDPLAELADDPKRPVRLAAYEALGKLGKPAAGMAEPLVKKLQKTEDPLEKVAILDTINRVGGFKLELLADQMQVVEKRLARLDPGHDTLASQDIIVGTLDDLIDAIEDQMSQQTKNKNQQKHQQKRGGGKSGGKKTGQGQKSGSKKKKSCRCKTPGDYFGGMNAAGDAKRVGAVTRRWPVALPGVEYEEVMQAAKDHTLPEKYRKMLEAYYESLSKDAVR